MTHIDRHIDELKCHCGSDCFHILREDSILNQLDEGEIQLTCASCEAIYVLQANDFAELYMWERAKDFDSNMGREG